MRNYVDELTAATGIIKHACDMCFNYDSSSPTMFRDESFDLQEYIMNSLKNTFEGDVVVTQITKEETFASHRTWTIEVYGTNQHIIRNSKFFGIQVSLIEAKDIIMTIIYLPFLDEMYTATLGGGAYLNGNQIFIKPRPVNESIVAFGKFNEKDDAANALQMEMIKNIRHVIDEIYMTGSNALNFAYLASGKINGFVYFSNNICSINPGILLCQEAGAYISNVEGTQYDYANNNIVIADSPDMLAAIKQSTVEPIKKGDRFDNRIRIGYLGIQGDLAEQAANELANRQKYRFVDFIPSMDEKQIVRDMQIHKIDYAVVPISTNKNQVYRKVTEQLSKIRYEIVDSCTCHLMLNIYKRTKDIPNSDLTRVITDENYYSYIDTKLRLMLPNVERLGCSCVSVVAKDLRDDKYNDYTVVICSPQSGDLNRLSLVAEDIVEDSEASVEFRMIRYMG